MANNPSNDTIKLEINNKLKKYGILCNHKEWGKDIMEMKYWLMGYIPKDWVKGLEIKGAFKEKIIEDIQMTLFNNLHRRYVHNYITKGRGRELRSKRRGGMQRGTTKGTSGTIVEQGQNK